jgi:hypothetical protein
MKKFEQHMLLIRLDKEKLKQFKILCMLDRVSMNHIINEFIDIYLEARNEESPNV